MKLCVVTSLWFLCVVTSSRAQFDGEGEGEEGEEGGDNNEDGEGGITEVPIGRCFYWHIIM